MLQVRPDRPAGGDVPEPCALSRAAPDVRRVRPSGLNATAVMALECVMGWPMARPVAASHSRAVLSRRPPPVRMVLPSGLNATALTASECVMGWPMGSPVRASHSRAVLSALPVRMVLPSGLNATAGHRSRMPHGLDRWAGMCRRPKAAPSYRHRWRGWSGRPGSRPWHGARGTPAPPTRPTRSTRREVPAPGPGRPQIRGEEGLAVVELNAGTPSIEDLWSSGRPTGLADFAIPEPGRPVSSSR